MDRKEMKKMMKIYPFHFYYDNSSFLKLIGISVILGVIFVHVT